MSGITEPQRRLIREADQFRLAAASPLMSSRLRPVGGSLMREPDKAVGWGAPFGGRAASCLSPRNVLSGSGAAVPGRTTLRR